MKIGLYGLLHLDEGEPSAQNVFVKNFRDQIAVYVGCAINLSNSLQSKGIAFTLLTNRKDVVEEIIQPEWKVLQVKEIPFNTKVPHGIKFYSAHFALDAFRYLSALSVDYVGFCDLDMVCINDYPLCLSNNIKQKIPMCYDISDQVIPAYGHEVIIRDLEAIHCLESEGRWSGGEFISGAPAFFLTLTKEIDSIYDNYINNLESQHHIGIEATLSAALEIIRKKGTYIADAGTLGIVGRFWNAKTLHPQKPFDYFQQCFLLHLPADKRFLVDMAREKTMELSKFAKLYDNYRNPPIIRLIRAIRRIVIV
jgi:hypothetical protein